MSNLADNSFTWNPQNFAGFFYDIKKDLGTETLKFVLTGGNELSGNAPYGVTYTTTAQNKAYERALWGSYKVISFQAEKYFAGYNQGVDEVSGSDIFSAESIDKNSLSKEQLEKILIDSKDEMIVTSVTPLKLGEGYELFLKLIDTNGMYLELTKNGQVVDSKVISPSKEGATEVDKTYWYKNPAVGEQKKLVTIAIHFKNAINIQNQTVATVDGIWQISDIPIEVKADTQYNHRVDAYFDSRKPIVMGEQLSETPIGIKADALYDKMTIRVVDAYVGTITMNNKDNSIILSKNMDITLMPGINLRTADNDTLRFYIYSKKDCQCE